MHYTHTTLPNGTQLVLAPLKETQAATILILYRVGSRYEPLALNGSSHFIEHLMFKGTKKRPTTLAISKELDGVGAEFNAFTAKDHTGYYIKLAASELPLAVDILQDMLYHSLFLEKELNRERQVVIEEINMYEDNPMMLIEDLGEMVAFPRHQLGRSIAGPRKVIQGVNRDRLLAFRDRYYLPSNMLVAVAGRFDAAKLERRLTRAFGRARPGGSAPTFKPFPKRALSFRALIKHRQTEQVNLHLAFPGLPLKHPDAPTLALLALILGGTMSSRLFIAIRERQGLCYRINAGLSPYQDVGLLTIQAGLDKSRLESAVAAIGRELKRMAMAPVTRDELRRAKEHIRGKLVLQLEDSEHVAHWLGKQQLLTDRIETPEQRLEKIERVTARDIQRLARAFLKPSRAAIALIGPHRGTPAFRRKLQRWLAGKAEGRTSDR